MAEVKRFRRNDNGLYDLTVDAQPFRVEVNGWTEAERGQRVDFALLIATSQDPFNVRDKSFDQVRFGRLVGSDAVPAQTLGFPRAQIGPDVGFGKFLNIEDARGFVLPLSGARSKPGAGMLVESLGFQVTSGTPTSRPEASLWSGMSGSSLFSGDHLVGIVVQDRASIAGRLNAVPISRIFGREGRKDANACLALMKDAERVDVLDPVWSGGDVLRPAYEPMPIRGTRSETDLLRARHDVVPFKGRRSKLQELISWCGQSERRVRLLYGDGAVGKTRLARELCRRMSERGWVAGIIDPLDPLRIRFSEILQLKESRLVVIDDADAHAGLLRTLLDDAATKKQSNHPLRILAIAHNNGQWWQAIRRRYEALVEETDPPPLGAPNPDERRSVYRSAVESYISWHRHEIAQKEQEGKPRHDGNTPDLEEPEFESYLLVLIQALLEARAESGIKESPAVVGGTTPRSLRSALLDYAIDVERETWVTSAGNAGLNDDPVLLERVVAVSSLAAASGPTEGAGETEAARLLKLVPDLADEPEWRRRAYARWQNVQLSGDGYLRTLQPLRLAQRLGSKVIATFPGIAMQMLDLNGEGTPRNPTDQTRQILNILQLMQFVTGEDDSASQHTAQSASTSDVEQHAAREALATALRQHVAALVRLVKRVAVTDHDDYARIVGTSLATALNATLSQSSARNAAPEALAQLDESCPDVLLELATVVARHAVDYYQRSGEPNSQRNRAGLATALHRWSRYLADSGERSKAREAAWTAVDTYRALEQMEPSPENRLGLACALSDLGDRLTEVGQFENSYDQARDAVRLFEQLNRDEPGEYLFPLAKALCTNATAACYSGRFREALQSATEACDVSSRLGGVESETQQEETDGLQAFTKRCLAWQLCMNGRVDEAQAPAEEACATYSLLAGLNAGRWRREYARALSVLGWMYKVKEMWRESIDSLEEAVNSYSELELMWREAVRPYHAIALQYLAASHFGIACQRRRDVEAKQFRGENPVSAATKSIEGEVRGHYERALDWVEKSLKCYQSMSHEDRWANRSTHFVAQRLKAEILNDLARHQEAENAASEALDLHEDSDRTWQTRFDRAYAHMVRAQAIAGKGLVDDRTIAEFESAKRVFIRLNAELPGRAEDHLETIDSAIAKCRATQRNARRRRGKRNRGSGKA
jgi:tetratricopeptide (TPR) repeat protein